MVVATQEYKVTYYIGAMLAQGGLLMIREDSLLFAPRALERAMGASDTVIPFDKVKTAEITGTITESLIVRTPEKNHRFVGSDLYKILDLIHGTLQLYQSRPRPPAAAALPPAPPAASAAPAVPAAPVAAPATVPGAVCPDCRAQVRPDYNFCPACRKELRKMCPDCREPLESGWKFCAACGRAAA